MYKNLLQHNVEHKITQVIILTNLSHIQLAFFPRNILHKLKSHKKRPFFFLFLKMDLYRTVMPTHRSLFVQTPSGTLFSSELVSLLPAFLVVVVVFGAGAGGRPLGAAAVLLGLLQELVQTEGILLELDRPVSPLPVLGPRELFVRSKPEHRQEAERWNYPLNDVQRHFLTRRGQKWDISHSREGRKKHQIYRWISAAS